VLLTLPHVRRSETLWPGCVVAIVGIFLVSACISPVASWPFVCCLPASVLGSLFCVGSFGCEAAFSFSVSLELSPVPFPYRASWLCDAAITTAGSKQPFQPLSFPARELIVFTGMNTGNGTRTGMQHQSQQLHHRVESVSWSWRMAPAVATTNFKAQTEITREQTVWQETGASRQEKNHQNGRIQAYTKLTR
jgi:hypothetical protein